MAEVLGELQEFKTKTEATGQGKNMKDERIIQAICDIKVEIAEKLGDIRVELRDNKVDLAKGLRENLVHTIVAIGVLIGIATFILAILK